MPMLSFATKRLNVTDWSAALSGSGRAALEADIGPILTPAVLAPLPPAVQDLGQGVAGWIDRQAAHAQGALILAEGQTIGLILLAQPEPGAIHIGYLFAQSAWGRGYASEMLIGLVAHLRADAPLLRAGVAKDNPASARVLVKAGFTRLPDEPGSDIWQFEQQL